MMKLTSFLPALLLALPLATACSSKPSSQSTLADDQTDQGEDLESLKEYALNETGKNYFAEGIREVLGTRLENEKFPFYDKRALIVDLGPFGQINKPVISNGESWLLDPKANLTVRLENMVRVEGSPSDWTFELAGSSPARGTVHVNFDGSNVVDTMYSANIDIRFFGKLHYEPQFDEVLDETIVDIKASVYDLTSVVKDLHFDTGLIQVIDGIIQDQVNGMLKDAKPALLNQTNASITEAQGRGELRANFTDFFSIFPVGG